MRKHIPSSASFVPSFTTRGQRYGDSLIPTTEKEQVIAHLKNVTCVSAKLGVSLVYSEKTTA